MERYRQRQRGIVVEERHGGGISRMIACIIMVDGIVVGARVGVGWVVDRVDPRVGVEWVVDRVERVDHVDPRVGRVGGGIGVDGIVGGGVNGVVDCMGAAQDRVGGGSHVVDRVEWGSHDGWGVGCTG